MAFDRAAYMVEYRKKYYADNKEKISEYNRAYREANGATIAAKKAAYDKTEKAKALSRARVAKHKEAHPERQARYAAISLEHQAKRIAKLEDKYVAKLLGASLEECPSELVEAERARLQVHRYLLEHIGERKEKKCYHCKTYKPLTEFFRFRRSPDGHEYKCKPCRKATRNFRSDK